MSRRMAGALAMLVALSAPAATLADSSLDRVTIGGDAAVRWLQVDVDARAPDGLYGEPLETATWLLRRLRLDVSVRVDDRLSAGGRVRLSNEPDVVLALGPEYYARGEGSVFVAWRTSWIRARAGFYDASFTPFTLMRWDARDLGLGGAAGGCACAGAVTGVRVESLEEISPLLTFEGARADGAAGDALDWTVLYARPHAATLESPPGLDGVYDLDTFSYHEDLYAARVTLSRFHAPTLGARRLGVTALHVREDDRQPAFCPAPPSAEICRPAETTAFGADADVPIGRFVRLDAEWLRSVHREDHRPEGEDARWANAVRLAGAASARSNRLLLEAAWLRLDTGFASPYGALTYRANREGARARLHAAAGAFAVDAFVRRLVPIARELDEGSGRAIHVERTFSARAEARLAPVIAAAGWQVETTALAAAARDVRRDIVQLELVVKSLGAEWTLMEQLIHEEGADPSVADGDAALLSVTVRAWF